MNKIERIEEMEKQLSALKSEVESESKPKRVRVYIKEDAKELTPSLYWTTGKNHMPGSVFDVKKVVINGEDRIHVWADEEHSDYWNFFSGSYVVVEGSLEDLK